MKKIFAYEYSLPQGKTAAAAKLIILRGTAFVMDAHSIRTSLSTPFFPRR